MISLRGLYCNLYPETCFSVTQWKIYYTIYSHLHKILDSISFIKAMDITNHLPLKCPDISALLSYGKKDLRVTPSFLFFSFSFLFFFFFFLGGGLHNGDILHNLLTPTRVIITLSRQQILLIMLRKKKMS